MFNQRRSFFKGKLFYIILLALFGFGIWLNTPANTKDSGEVNADTGYKAASDSGIRQGSSDPYDIMDNIIDKNQAATPSGTETTVDKGTAVDAANTGYYLVKEINGIIMIFYYNEEGKESFIRETNIAFSLLSISDQQLFKEGIIKHTPEELDELLQDFES